MKFIEWLISSSHEEMSGVKDWWFSFTGDYNAYIKLALLLAMGVMVWLVIRSYRREGQSPRRAKVILGTIRCAVVVLLFMMIFRPAIVLRFTRALHQSVVVLLDDSLSMSFGDRYADKGDLENAAKLAGAKPEEMEKITRSQLLQKAINHPDSLIAKAGQEHPIQLLRISTTQPGSENYTRPLGEQINKVIDASDGKKPPSPAQVPADLARQLSLLTANGFETNVAKGIRDSIDVFQGRRPSCLIVIGDGQNTTADSGNRLNIALAYANQSSIPIYSVLVGDPTPPKNVAVTALRRRARSARTPTWSST